MVTFPAAAVEGIIREEMLRGHETKLWTSPQARYRYSLLLSELVVRQPGRNDRLQQLRRGFEAHRELSRFCSDRKQICAFPPDTARHLVRVLDAVEDALVSVIARWSTWPADTLISHESGEAFLQAQVSDVRAMRETAEEGFTEGRNVGFPSARAVRMDEALQVGRVLLMTGDEARTFGALFDQAQAMLREYLQMFAIADDAATN